MTPDGNSKARVASVLPGITPPALGSPTPPSKAGIRSRSRPGPPPQLKAGPRLQRPGVAQHRSELPSPAAQLPTSSSILPLEGPRAEPCRLHRHDPDPSNSTRLLTPWRRGRRRLTRRRHDSLNLPEPALKLSASSFKLTALKDPGSTNQVARRLSKEPIRAKPLLGRASRVARARKKKKTAAGEKAGGRAPTVRKRRLSSQESVVLLFLVIRNLLLALYWSPPPILAQLKFIVHSVQ